MRWWLVLLLGCSRAPSDSTPEGALDQFLDACEQVPRDPAAATRAIALLSPASRKALEQRAQKASSLIGRPLTVEQIFVPSFSPLKFEISRTTTTLDEGGGRAMVEVTGPDPNTQRARVPMELEGTSWRVVIAIP
jgi:hypothetical protein